MNRENRESLFEEALDSFIPDHLGCKRDIVWDTDIDFVRNLVFAMSIVSKTTDPKELSQFYDKDFLRKLL